MAEMKYPAHPCCMCGREADPTRLYKVDGWRNRLPVYACKYCFWDYISIDGIADTPTDWRIAGGHVVMAVSNEGIEMNIHMADFHSDFGAISVIARVDEFRTLEFSFSGYCNADPRPDFRAEVTRLHDHAVLLREAIVDERRMAEKSEYVYTRAERKEIVDGMVAEIQMWATRLANTVGDQKFDDFRAFRREVQSFADDAHELVIELNAMQKHSDN